MDENKQRALAAALGQIERQFGKGAVMLMGEQERQEVPAISTGSLGLDIALGIGGLPKGRIVEIYGPESSGKTTLTLSVIAQAQKAGATCAFVDAEHALDPEYAATESMMITSTALERTSMSVISSACSPVSGWETSRSSTFTPSAPSIAGEVRNPLNPGTLVIMRRLLCQAISVF